MKTLMMPHYVAYDLGLHCLPTSHKRDAGLKWLKYASSLFAFTY